MCLVYSALRIHIYQEHRHPSWFQLATQVKVKILALCNDRDNFLDYPARDDFNLKNYESTAHASMAANTQLTHVFAECVPNLTTDTGKILLAHKCARQNVFQAFVISEDWWSWWSWCCRSSGKEAGH